MSTKLKLYKDAGLVVGVAVVTEAGTEKVLADVDEAGRIIIPAGMEPKGFKMIAAAKAGFAVMKNVGDEGGGYHQTLSALTGVFPKGYNGLALNEVIPVLNEDGFRRTPWHGLPSNRFDYFNLDKNGGFTLFQAGVVCRGDGESWWPKLLGEYRWRGHLYETDIGGYVAIPENPKWGSFEGGSSKRTQIFETDQFRSMVEGVKLPTWHGTDQEVDPPLPKPGPGQVVVTFYIAFAGRKGQGVVMAGNKDTAWVLEQDLVGVQPDPDGEKRLWRGDILSFDHAVYNWGAKRDGKPKLEYVELVERLCGR